MLLTASIVYHTVFCLSSVFLSFFQLSFSLNCLKFTTRCELLACNSFDILSCTCLFVKYFFKNFFLFLKRRKRDLNPRAAINDLLPFQGSPFSRLGISPCADYPIYIKMKPLWFYLAENVGFEPTVPFGITGFQDQPLKPLGQLSEQRSLSIT